MNRFGLIFLLFLSCLPAFSQTSTFVTDRIFNFGGTIGFIADLPVATSITINDQVIDDVTVKYKVGMLASVFCRVNIDRFFLQPSLSWVSSEHEMHIGIPINVLPSADDPASANASILHQLNIEARSLEVPILIGYNIVKERPYGLSVFAGPKIKYKYKLDYTTLSAGSTYEFVSEDSPYGVSIATGVSVTIWRLFFDFMYEFGINQTESDFRQKYSADPETLPTVVMDRRINAMSFSLGFLF